MSWISVAAAETGCLSPPLFIDENGVACCLVGLGSNVGDRIENLDRAVAALAASPHLRVDSRSANYSTNPVGGPPGQSEFLNGVLRCETSLSPEDLLQVLRGVEDLLGRQRSARWSPRTMDLDLLLHGEWIIETPHLIVPHPRMSFRRFVLLPASEVGGEMIHPRSRWSVRQLLERLDTAPNYVALTGGPSDVRRHVAGNAATILGCTSATDPVRTEIETCLSQSDSPGGLTRQREWVLRRLEALNPGTIDAGIPRPNQFTISDYWIGDLRVWENLVPSPSGPLEHLESSSVLPETLLKPKLLVFFDQEQSHAHAPSWSRSFEKRLREIVHEPYQSPVLMLKTPSIQDATNEIVAAILAMQTV